MDHLEIATKRALVVFRECLAEGLGEAEAAREADREMVVALWEGRHGRPPMPQEVSAELEKLWDER